jgi:hypothetical protein
MTFLNKNYFSTLNIFENNEENNNNNNNNNNNIQLHCG